MGGRGASAGSSSIWGDENDNTGRGGKMDPDFPARMNRLYNGNNMSISHTTSVFEAKHGNSKTEHLIAHDDNGFVSVYSHGGEHSVGFAPYQVAGKHVIHNHPSGSTFSMVDLTNLSTTEMKSITATSTKGHRYKAEKTDKFDASGWGKALKSAKTTVPITDMESYNNAVHGWLQNNAHKYGVKYTRD